MELHSAGKFSQLPIKPFTVLQIISLTVEILLSCKVNFQSCLYLNPWLAGGIVYITEKLCMKTKSLWWGLDCIIMNRLSIVVGVFLNRYTIFKFKGVPSCSTPEAPAPEAPATTQAPVLLLRPPALAETPFLAHEAPATAEPPCPSPEASAPAEAPCPASTLEAPAPAGTPAASGLIPLSLLPQWQGPGPPDIPDMHPLGGSACSSPGHSPKYFLGWSYRGSITDETPEGKRTEVGVPWTVRGRALEWSLAPKVIGGAFVFSASSLLPPFLFCFGL